MSLHHGDCLDVMAGMDPESVDAIVTDPPYGLEFMGKEWDRLDTTRARHKRADEMSDPAKRPFLAHSVSYQGGASAYGFHRGWAEAAYRVAKPSAYLLAFGGTRTVHRMTCALEDAGWIIRDMLVWGYASGFPKSKASLKPAWEPIVMARKPGPLRMLAIDECRIPAEPYAYPNGPKGNVDPTSIALPRSEEPYYSDGGRWPANIVLTDPIFDGGIEGVVGGGETTPLPARGIGVYDPAGPDSVFAGVGGTGTMHHDTGTYSRFFEIPGGVTCQWCGAASPVTASSPPSSELGGSAPSHAAIEAFPDSDTTTGSPTTSATASASSSSGSGPTSATRSSRASRRDAPTLSSDPANNAARIATSFVTIPTTPSLLVCSSCADDAMRSYTGGQASVGSREQPIAWLIPKADRTDREPVLGGLAVTDAARVESAHSTVCGKCGRQRVNVPGAACACLDPEWVRKPQTARANFHPTVKPTDLMRHLVRLVTPTGGTVLDPFLGSGTTALAAEMEGFDWIGIEREAEYIAIAEARLNGTQRGLGLEAS